MDRPIADFITWLPNHSPGAAYLLMQLTPGQFLSPSVRRQIDAAVFEADASEGFRRARGSSLASASNKFINNGSYVVDVQKFVTAQERDQALEWRRKTLDVYIERDGEFGNFSGLMTNVVNFAQGLADNNKALAAQVSIERIVKLWFYGWGTKRQKKTREQNIAFATRLAPLFTKLGEYKTQGRSLATYPDYLRAAVEMINAKLDWEWQISSLNAVPALRELRPAASALAKLLLGAAPRDPRLRSEMQAAGFRLLQIAMLSDTAASLNVAVQKRGAERQGALELVARRQELLLDISVYDAMAREQENYIKPIGAERAAAKAQRELDTVNAAIASKGVPLAELDANASIQTVEDAARLLAPDEVALLVHTDDRSTAVVLVEPSGEIRFRLVDLDRANLESAVSEIRRGLEISEQGYARFPATQAHRLYRQVFGDVAGKLEAAKRVVSVVSGPLQALPLAVLVTRAPEVSAVSQDKARSADIAWFALKAAETRTPSLGSFTSLVGAQADGLRESAFLGVGDPVLAPPATGTRSLDIGSADGTKALADVERLRSLASLPETAEELRAISETLGTGSTRLFLGHNATETEIKSATLDGYSIVAFATHGVVAGQAFEGNEPGLVLTPPLEATEQDDGFLSMSEIAGLRLNADLVLLSACDTATSDGRPMADGLSGLARAFFTAGARNVLATHWSIPSLPSVAVTTIMMRDYVQRKSRDVLQQPRAAWSNALNAAQRALIRNVGPDEFAHPASWGAFQIIGAD